MITQTSSLSTPVETYDAVRRNVLECRAVLEPPQPDGKVGLEVEAFLSDPTGRRLDTQLVFSSLDRALGRRPGTDPTYQADRATVSFEPGGQIEVATEPARTVSEAIEDQMRIWESLTDVIPGRVVWCGLDHWNRVSDVAQQLAAPRYPAMDAYLARRSPAGRVMMRCTASVQVNLDGGGPRFGARLAAAQVVAPLITAAFATSPLPGAHSARARVWQRLDPTRTGFLADLPDPAEAVEQKALAADMLVVRRGNVWHPGTPGLSFGAWVENGDSTWGPATIDDLDYHLTTLFCEVRPRHGTLEIRGPDSVPIRWLAAVTVLIAAAVYHPGAGAEIADLVDRHDRTDLWRRAAIDGMRDPIVGPLARQAWQIALTASREMSDTIRSEHLDTAAEFFHRYIEANSSLADEMRAALERGPEVGLRWASNQEETR